MRAMAYRRRTALRWFARERQRVSPRPMSYLKSLIDLARQPRRKKLSKDDKRSSGGPVTSGSRSGRRRRAKS
jgi:hypothetical protein